MSFLTVLSGYLDTTTHSRLMADLYARSDRDLEALGYSRSEVRRHFNGGLGF